jgi:hypothetical protein
MAVPPGESGASNRHPTIEDDDAGADYSQMTAPGGRGGGVTRLLCAVKQGTHGGAAPSTPLGRISAKVGACHGELEEGVGAAVAAVRRGELKPKVPSAG